MSLGQQLAGELMQMGGAELPLALSTNGNEGSVSVVICQWSPLAVGVESIQVQSATGSIPSRELGEKLAKKLNYLSEPVRVLEIDSASGAAQLRSDPPRRIDDSIEYFEVQIARGGAIRMQRFRTQSGGARASTAFTLTFDTLARVIDDLMAP